MIKILSSLVLLTALATPAWGQSATYYHPSLSGRTMANGKPYRPGAMTAASNNFKLGTRVRVTNRKTGRSVVVTITDRCGNCSIDLSKAAFQAIANPKQGRVRVHITRL